MRLARYVAAAVLAFAGALALAASPRQQADPAREAAAQSERMRHLAGDSGCTLCHREAAAPQDGTPLAPSFAQIAARYRGREDAEERLTRVVIEGADPADPHWNDRAEFTRMGGNARRLSQDEARALVRWILAAMITVPRRP